MLTVDEAKRLAAAAQLAPDREEFLMYISGITPRQVAALSETHVNGVTSRLRPYWYAIPGLRELHARNLPPQPAGALVSRRWFQRRDEVEAVHQVKGTLPDERRLADWLYRQRKAAAAGTLTTEQLELLDRIPGWREGRLRVAVRERHAEFLEKLVLFHLETGRWPQYKSANPVESSVGHWLHGRRSNANRGTLDPALLTALDTRVPGWRGRQHKPDKHLRE